MTDIESMEDLGIDGPYISNFDHEIPDKLDGILRARPGEILCRHAGWNFHGYVWFDGERFVEQVWRFGTPVAELAGDTLDEVRTRVNQEYGSD